MGLSVGLEGIPEIDTSEICPHCSKGRLLPMYDEHPNWINFVGIVILERIIQNTALYLTN